MEINVELDRRFAFLRLRKHQYKSDCLYAGKISEASFMGGTTFIRYDDTHVLSTHRDISINAVERLSNTFTPLTWFRYFKSARNNFDDFVHFEYGVAFVCLYGNCYKELFLASYRSCIQ
jgi:hypothetical protein